MFSNTGVAIPEDFDTVIPIEEVEIQSGRVSIRTAPGGRARRSSPPGVR